MMNVFLDESSWYELKFYGNTIDEIEGDSIRSKIYRLMALEMAMGHSNIKYGTNQQIVS